jgi:hypothetical protein
MAENLTSPPLTGSVRLLGLTRRAEFALCRPKRIGPHRTTSSRLLVISALLDTNPTGPRDSRLTRTKSPRERAAVAAALELTVHPLMLRHACGYAPAGISCRPAD